MRNRDFDRLNAPELVKRDENNALMKSIAAGEKRKTDEARDWGRIIAEKYVFRWNCGEKRIDILVPSAVKLDGKESVKTFYLALYEYANKEVARKNLTMDLEEFQNGVFSLKKG